MRSRIAIPGAIASIIQFSYFLLQIRIDPNPHHDGIILASAIASSEGQIPNRDVFNQYGPFSALIDGLWLEITSPTLIQLRLFNSFILMASAILLYLLLSRMLNPLVASLVSTVWVFTGPTYILPATTPWPSIFTNFLLLIALHISVHNKQDFLTSKSRIFLSVLLTLGTLFRLQSIASLVLILFFFAAKKQWNVVRDYCVGALVGFSLLAIYFSRTNSLDSWVKDCIVWAANRYSSPQTFGKAWIVDTSLILLFPIVSLVWVILITWLSKQNRPAIQTMSICFFSFVLIICNFLNVEDKSYLNPVYLLLSGSQNWLSWMGYVSVSGVVLVTASFLKHNLASEKRATIWLLGFTSILQLYPAHDALHLWWITPVVIVSAVYLYKSWLAVKVRLLVVVLISTLAVSFIVQLNLLQQPRDPFMSPALSGMYGSPKFVKILDATSDLLAKVPQGNNVNFDCVDGLFSVLNGRYAATGLNMVSWGPQKVIESHNPIQYRFSCYTTQVQKVQFQKESFQLVGEVPIDQFTSNSLWKLQK